MYDSANDRRLYGHQDPGEHHPPANFSRSGSSALVRLDGRSERRVVRRGKLERSYAPAVWQVWVVLELSPRRMIGASRTFCFTRFLDRPPRRIARSRHRKFARDVRVRDPLGHISVRDTRSPTLTLSLPCRASGSLSIPRSIPRSRCASPSRMCRECTANVLRVYCEYAANVLRMCRECTANVPRMCRECTANVLRMYDECAANVRRMCRECAANVPNLLAHSSVRLGVHASLGPSVKTHDASERAFRNLHARLASVCALHHISAQLAPT
jgi:hypothetical protein